MESLPPSSFAQISSTLSRIRGCPWAWTETFTSPTQWRRTAGETTAASPPSPEYERSFRRPPCLSLSRQVGVSLFSLSPLDYCLPLKPAWRVLWFWSTVHLPAHSPIPLLKGNTSKAIPVSHCFVCARLFVSMILWCDSDVGDVHHPHFSHVHCVCVFFFLVCLCVCFLVSSVMILGKSDSSENGKLY